MPKVPGSGRQPGTRNKRTSNQLLDAKRAVAEARATGRKLAKEVADDFMHIFANMAMEVRPVTEREIRRGVEANPKADEAKFKALSAILLAWVTALMPYQSAKLQTIKLDVGELGEGDVEEVGALATLERLLDAYAAADEEERRFRAARTVAGQEVEPEPDDDGPKLVAVRQG
jgi:hypothetical protein